MSHLVQLHDKEGPMFTRPVPVHLAIEFLSSLSRIPEDEIRTQYGKARRMLPGDAVLIEGDRPPTRVRIERVG